MGTYKLGNGGMGGGGIKNVHQMNRSARMRFRGKTKRGRESKIFGLLVQLIVLEYRKLDPTVAWESFDPDHILGRNAPNFRLGAMLDPQNIQLLSREQHEAKTNPPEGSEFNDKTDFRNPGQLAAMVALSDKIIACLPPVHNELDLKHVFKMLIEKESQIADEISDGI